MELILATLNGIRRRLIDVYPRVSAMRGKARKIAEAAAFAFVFVWIAVAALSGRSGSSGAGFIDLLFSARILRAAVLSFAALAFFGVVFLGLLRAVFSREVKIGWKGILVALVGVIAAQALAMNHLRHNPVEAKDYAFFDMAHSNPGSSKITVDNFVKAEGSWRSDAKIDLPWQTTSLECFKDRGLCVDATVRINAQKELSIVTTYWEIEEWSAAEVRLKEDVSAMCTADRLRVDRRSEVVTMTRLPKSPAPDGCQGMSAEPITMFLDYGVGFGDKS